MKALQLIRLLSPKERDEFSHHLRFLKNERLGLAFSFLAKSREEPGADLHEKLFKQIFGKAWSKKDDYLLRNELRLLSRQLESFMARKLFDLSDQKYQNEANYLYLTSLLEREAWDLFQREAQQSIREAENANNFRTLIRLRELYLHYLTVCPEHSEERTRHHKESVEAFDLIRYRVNEYLKGEIDIYRAQLARTEHEVNPAMPLTLPPPPDYPDMSNDPFVRYYHAAAQAYLNRGEKTINSLKEVLSLIDVVSSGLIEMPHRKQIINANIALELFLLGRHEEADVFYKEVMSSPKHPSTHRQAAVAFNYISNLIRLSRYAEALEEINKFEKTLRRIGGLWERALCQMVMCLIYTNRDNEAKQLILENNAAVDYDVLLYMRLALAIAFYKEGKTDLCLRELENIEQSLRRASDQFQPFIHVVRIFNKAVQRPDNVRSRKAIQHSVDEYRKVWSSRFDMLPVRWILDFAQHEIAG
jgi:hypothetical protein